MATSITLNLTNVDGKLRSGGVAKPSYTPLYKMDVSAIANDANSPIFGFGSKVSNTRSVYNSKSIKVVTVPSNPGVVCGSHEYAGRNNTPTLIPLGNAIWQRFKLYIPSTFSFGYAYGAGATDVGACTSLNADGSLTGWKFLTFAPNVGTSRLYLNCPNSLRAVNQTLGSGTLALEANPAAQQNLNIIFPRDQWFTLETAAKVSNTGDGWFRAWMNDVLIAESIRLGSTSVSTIDAEATGVSQWGLGQYINGTQWTDGAAGRSEFWVDEVLVATDVGGYGAPTATDSNGYKMIGSAIKNRDFWG